MKADIDLSDSRATPALREPARRRRVNARRLSERGALFDVGNDATAEQKKRPHLYSHLFTLY